MERKKKKEEEEGKEKNGLKTKGNFAPILMLSSNIYLKSIHFVVTNYKLKLDKKNKRIFFHFIF